MPIAIICALTGAASAQNSRSPRVHHDGESVSTPCTRILGLTPEIVIDPYEHGA
jgi:hypothetical protein